MKKLLTMIFMITLLSVKSQHVPNKVEQEILRRAIEHKIGIDSIQLENYKYIVKIDHMGVDTLNFRYDLLRKEKLYTDYYKAAGLSYFFLHMGALVVLPGENIQKDKYLHFGAGYIAGLGTNILVYKLTEKKWLAFAAGILFSGGLGLAKEFIYDQNFGGTISNPDWETTLGGGIDGSSGGLIYFGHKEKVKQYIQP